MQHSQLSLGWVLPRPFAGSGGLNNIFRMIGALQQWGHSSVIYCCDSESAFGSQEALTAFIRANWGLNGIECVFGTAAIKPHDILLATHWSTAFKVRSDTRAVRKAYFVQDFEPLFFPMGNEYLLAENTYAFGLPCITLGHWLESLLRDNYALDTCGFDFPVDTTVYCPGNETDPRPFDIVYYGQPDKPRRAFQLGYEALRLVKEARPQTTIAMFGSEALAKVEASFEFRNFGLQKPNELARLYQQSKIGLVLSTSNPSLIPCEMMACGAAAVDLLRGNNLHDYRPGSIRLAEQNPEALAAELLALLEEEDERRQQVVAAAAMVAERSYEASARTVEAALLRLLITGRVAHAESPCMDIRQELAGAGCHLPLDGKGEIRQSFVCRMPNLTRIDVSLVYPSEGLEGEFVLTLKEAGSAELIHRVVKPGAPAPENGFTEFNFPPIPDSANKTFIVGVAFHPKDPAAHTPISLFANSSDLCLQGALLLDGKPVEGTLRFRTFCRPQLHPPGVMLAAVFEQALQIRGQAVASANDPAVSGLQAIYKHLSLIERRPAAVSAEVSARKAKHLELLKLLNGDKHGSDELKHEHLVRGCRDLFREELDQVEREEQAKLLLEQGRAAEASGQSQEMESLLLEALRKVPEYEDALLFYGRWLLRQKRTQEGFAQLNTLLSLNPRCAAAYNEIGRGMYSAGMIREARVLFARAVRCQPQDREGWLNLVELHYEQGTRAEGAKILAQWLKVQPDDAEGLRWNQRYNPSPDSPKATPTQNMSARQAQAGRALTVATLLAEPDEYSCAYLRVASVFKQLEQDGTIHRSPASVFQNGQVRILPEKLQSADIVLVQRQMAGILPYGALVQNLGGRKPKIVFDLDDALTLLPEFHRAYEPYRRIVPAIEEYLRRADLVTVSTPQLAALYRSLNANIVVLPNALDARLWSSPSAGSVPADRIRILFSGTLDHERDLHVVEKALLDLLKAHPDSVEFLYWGNVTERLRALPQVKSAHDFKPDYTEYAALLRDLAASFALVPLEDNPFNRAKSPIKWLEYSACGIPGIYSDLSAYSQAVKHESTGLLVPNTREAWFAAMKSLVENPPLRQQLAARARETVMSSHTVERNARLWSQAYESLFADRGSLPAAEAAPRASIVIPVFNRLELTRQCLKAVRENTPAGRYEIIVVNNGSTDGTEEFLKAEEAAARLRLVQNAANLGFAKACNQGAAAARGKYLVFLNNDTEVQPDWLDALLRTAENNPRVGAVGGKLLFADATIQHAGVIVLNDQQHGDPLLAQHVFTGQPHDMPEANRPMHYQALTAACLLVPQNLFQAVGGFDEEYWNGYEDVDLCFKLREAGRPLVYQPECVVTHHESKSGPERFREVQKNIARLHDKWLKKIQPDYLVSKEGTVLKTTANCIVPYEAPSAGTATSPVTSIIILALDQLEHTRQCLESVVAHTKAPHELILVDNGSTDGTPEFLKEWQAAHPNCTVIRNATNHGFAAGNNQGLAVARGDYVLLLNNDTVVTEGWLEAMVNVFDQSPDTGVVGPVSNNVSGPQYVKEACYADLAALPEFAAKWTEANRGQTFESNRAVGFCLLTRRSVIERIGGLDDRFGSGNFEDDDFCIRARLAGFRIRVAKDAFVHHTGGQTFKGAKIDYHKAMLRNWELFRTKWKLGPEASLERGYPTPDSLPKGLEIKIPLPSLERTHKSDGGRHWTEQTSAPNSLRNSPGEARVLRTAPVPTVAKLGNLDQAKALLGRRDHANAWQAATAAIAVRPFHPEAWLLLAEIALAAGDSASARQCAQRARDLAPGWKAPKQFLQKPLKGSAKPDWLQPSTISNFKFEISNQLSVCIIAKNEEKFLAQCLASVKGLAAQVIVVDTGSTDRTVEIAKEHGAEVHHFDWCDDFSAARNAALEHATGDWILILDADEELPADQPAHLRTDMETAGLIACRLPLVNKGQEAEGVSHVPRLFRNAPGGHFTGRIHEQSFPSLIALSKNWGLRAGLGTARLLHHGYTKELVKDRSKIDRNLRLLRQAVEESPSDPNLVMNLGLEQVRSGDLNGGLTQYRKAFELMSALPTRDVAPELREALLTQYTYHLYKTREHDTIARVLDSPLAKSDGLTASLHFALGLSRFELKQYREAAEQMRQCIARRKEPALSPINTDILTAGPHHCLALSLARLGDAAGAEKAFEAAFQETSPNPNLKLDYARFLADQNRAVDALKRLHEIVAEDATHAAAWRLGGEIALSRLEFLAFAHDWTAEAIQHLPDDAVIIAQRAEALLLRQEVANARPLWERACNGSRPPRALAAFILCSAAGTDQVPPTRGAAEETATSRAFVEWYQRLISAGANETVSRLNSRVDSFRDALPTAARLLDSALAEAQKPPA